MEVLNLGEGGDGSKATTEELKRRYRSVVMKANYLAMDRPDVQWAVRRCAKK